MIFSSSIFQKVDQQQQESSLVIYLAATIYTVQYGDLLVLR
ncbi:hypothetical protein COO91_02569 [Nostoc flagelliforme CCNUN1]|uniref:Uncharacterized protein n=1 Tax=Nostoc flagelliforme CCNUN1 TaxID=2038116 RepID=A0A2K8SML4_9NOSO|nr:hypothetical protein COO91_02569 [Nostoc flagelliforme CCNUN1]